MVFFCCDGCGETLKKNKVDAHAARCRQCASVSCVDCSVSFWGDDYRQHTSCMTEAERYEKSVYQKPKKKRNPQEEWMNIVETCASSAPGHLRNHFNTMTSLDNIPRQEKKFVNFASNSLQLRGHNKKVVEEIWNCLKQEREKRIAERDKQQQAEKEKKELEEKKKEEQQQKEKQASKSKEGKESSNSSDDKDVSIDPKEVKKITKKTLKKAEGKSMGVKALRKTIWKEMALPKSAKKRLKTILLETAKASKDKIIIDGELIRLN
eukprot:jgi/Psemu1/238392/estExt_Genewise1.C_980006